MSSRWFLALLLVLLLSSFAFSQKLIKGFTREFAIGNLPVSPVLRSFDINGDNVSEVLVLKSGRFLILDGRTFSPIFQDTSTLGTANLSPADVNQDGYTDLVFTNNVPNVVVWYGPDFVNHRTFAIPSGFSTFAVRNREDGKIEFSLGYSRSFTFGPFPPDPCKTTGLGGVLHRYIDTIFIFSDSINLSGSPFWSGVTKISGSSDLLLIGYGFTNASTCMPSYYSRVYALDRIHLQSKGTFSFYAYSCLGCGPICPPPFVGPYTIGNIDLDEEPELIVKWEDFGPFCLPRRHTWSFAAWDILTGSRQWSRSDSGVLNVGQPFTLDLNQDGAEELLSYKVQDGKPGVIEFQTSSGAALGFTEFPIPSGSFLMGLFGNPLAPKLLMPSADSLIVFRIDVSCAVAKGDMNADGNVTLADVILEVDCVFLGTGNCDLCFADVNCDGVLSAADVVWELIAVFLQRPFPCS